MMRRALQVADPFVLVRFRAGGGAGLAHYPASNLFLGSGLFNLHRALDAGVKLAFGTDVSTGAGRPAAGAGKLSRAR